MHSRLEMAQASSEEADIWMALIPMLVVASKTFEVVCCVRYDLSAYFMHAQVFTIALFLRRKRA